MDHLRLPSIASLVSPTAEPLYHHRPSGALSASRATPSAHDPAGHGAAPSVDNQWTAINRQTPSSPSASATSFPPAPSSPHRHHASMSTPVTASPPFQVPAIMNQHRPSPLPERDPNPAPSRPIVSQRQDSAVSESTSSSHSSTRFRDVTSIAALSSDTSSSGPSLPVPACKSATATRPPSPPSSSLAADATSILSTRHDRRRASPLPFSPGPSSPAASTRHRALSDSRLVPSSQPATSPCLSPGPSRVDPSPPRVMAPPPHPVPSSPSNSFASASASLAAQAPGSPKASLSHANVNGSGSEAQPYARSRSLELSAAPAPRQSENGSSTQCLRCHRVWTFPPLIVDDHMVEPSETLNDMSTSTSQITNMMYEWNERKKRSFLDFKREHLVDPADADLRRHGRPHSTYAGTKRKPSGQVDDGTVSKFRRLSCHSSPCSSQLTPPPDHSPSSSPSHRAIPLDANFYGELTGMESSLHIARILGINDPNGPVRYPTPRDWSVEQENDQSPSPVK